MAKTYEVAFKIGASMAASFSKTMSGAGGALGELNKRMAEMSGQSKAAQRVMELRQGVQSASREFNEARARVAALGAELKKTDKPTKAMRREYDQAQVAVKRASDRLEQQRETLRTVAAQSGAAGKSTAQLVAEQMRLAQAGERASKAQAALQKNVAAQQANLKKRGELRGQLFDAVALGATIAAPVRQAMAWEQSLAEFNKVAAKTPDEVQKISMAAQEMAVATGVAREEILGAYIAAAQAGFDESEWEQYADVAAKMGIAFDITGEAAGEMLKAWRSGMGLSMGEAERLAAASNHIANNMNATAAGVGEVLQRSGALMRASGLSAEQSAAFAAALLSSGAESSTVATATKNIMLTLTKGSAASSAEQAALQALGFHDPARLAKAMQEAPEEAIMLVLQRIQGLAGDEQASVMGQLFGASAVSAVAPLVANLDSLANAFALVRDESQYLDSLQKEFEAMGATTANQMNKARESIKVITTTIGAGLLPSVNNVMAAFAPMALSFAKFAQNNEWLVKTVLLTVAGLIALKVAAITLGYAWTFVSGAVLAVRGALLAARTAWLLYSGAMAASATTSKGALIMSKALTAAQWLLNAAFWANPITWIVAGIIALIGAGYLLVKNWGSVTEFFTGSFDRIKSAFMNFTPLGWMIQGIQKLWQFFQGFSLFEFGERMIQTLVDGIKAMAAAPFKAVGAVLSKVRSLLPFSDAEVGPLSELTHNGGQIMATLAEGIQAEQGAPFEAIQKTLGAVLTAPLDAFRKARDWIGGGMRPALSPVESEGGQSRSIQITIHQEVNVSGGGGDVYQQARAGAADGARELAAEIQKVLKREERLSYG